MASYEAPEENEGIGELNRQRRTGVAVPRNTGINPNAGQVPVVAGSTGTPPDKGLEYTAPAAAPQKQSWTRQNVKDALSKYEPTRAGIDQAIRDNPWLGQQVGSQGGKIKDVNGSGETWDVINNLSSGNGTWQTLTGHTAKAAAAARPVVGPAAGGGGGGFTGTPAAGGGGGGGGGGVPAPGAGTSDRDALYNQLMDRSKQSLSIDAQTDPNIRQQADTYAASVERERRRYMDDTAERSGPLANIQGESRLSSEKAGQASALFEAQLVGREMQSRRDEIAESLKSRQGMLSQEQQNALQRELAQLDASIRNRQISSNESQFGADLGLRTELGRAGINLQQQGINSGNDQFMADLGLRAENQNSFWDAKRSGLE